MSTSRKRGPGFVIERDATSRRAPAGPKDPPVTARDATIHAVQFGVPGAGSP
ncbi:MAG TPA: hypothetical protein VIB48_04895 [Acidimicrobiia bacterium]